MKLNNIAIVVLVIAAVCFSLAITSANPARKIYAATITPPTNTPSYVSVLPLAPPQPIPTVIRLITFDDGSAAYAWQRCDNGGNIYQFLGFGYYNGQIVALRTKNWGTSANIISFTGQTRDCQLVSVPPNDLIILSREQVATGDYGITIQ